MGDSRGLFHRALRGAYRRLLSPRAKNTLSLRLLFEEPDRPPARIDAFDDEPVLVLAPHMDDEVIGCGGAVRRHVLAGAPVTTVFLTDGSRGFDPRRPESRLNGSERAALGERRKAESRAAAELLGVRELVFLDAPDGELAVTPALVQRLSDELRRSRPAVVYLPSLLDTHLDHWATNLLFEASAPALEAVRPDAVLRQYEVWTPLVVNAVVDLEPVLADKTRALECFESQRPDLDVVRLALGLNQYRSIYHGAGRGHAEAFWQSSIAGHRLLLERLRERR